MQRAFSQRRNEPLHRAGARAAGQWLSISAFAGLASGFTEEVVDSLHERTGQRYHLDLTPIALLAGLTFAVFYHLGNGIRHLAWDFGWGFELSQLRTSGIAVVAFAAGATLVTLIAAYAVGG